jgi:uncharacterized protein YjiS (DUF1127 family)
MAAICTAQPIHRRRREPALVRSVMALALNGMRKFARALKNRRQAVMLARMDDRMLADIGLNRSDLRDAYAQPLWRDPTDTLASRALERRLNRRGGVEARPVESRPVESGPVDAPSIAPDAPVVATRGHRSPWPYL